MAAADAECIVVGGGIGGAVLALALGRAGRSVLILEREAAPPAMATARPEILAGATLDTFNRLGIGERIVREAALPICALELFEAGSRRALFRITPEDLRRAGARPHSTDPAATRRIVLEEAQRTGRVTIEPGVEVEGLLTQGSAVVGVRALKAQQPCEYRAPLTVGDDGTHSRIRASMGVAIDLQEFPIDFFGAVVPGYPQQPERTGQGWLNVRGLRGGLFAALFLPIPGHRTALVFGVASGLSERWRHAPPEEFDTAASRLSPLCEEAGRLPKFPEGFGYFRRPFGHAARYAGDGVALLGDAAHPVTPAGGQGANMSVADAAVLAEVALDALRVGDCSASRLAGYEAVRRPANTRSLQFSARPRQVFKVVQAVPVLAPLLRWFLSYVNGRQELKLRFVGGVARAFMSSPQQYTTIE